MFFKSCSKLGLLKNVTCFSAQIQWVTSNSKPLGALSDIAALTELYHCGILKL
jgi:hypothetical protein